MLLSSLFKSSIFYSQKYKNNIITAKKIEISEKKYRYGTTFKIRLFAIENYYHLQLYILLTRFLYLISVSLIKQDLIRALLSIAVSHTEDLYIYVSCVGL